MAAFDGGAKSPLTLGLVLPSIFASLAFSRMRVLVVGVAAEVALGLLCLIGAPAGGTVLVGAVVLGAAVTIGARQADFHQEWRRQLAHHSLTDPLTGLLNRRGFAVHGRPTSADAAGVPRSTLVLIDLDLFKEYNDVHGHLAGDDLLRWVGSELLGDGAGGRLGGADRRRRVRRAPAGHRRARRGAAGRADRGAAGAAGAALARHRQRAR